MAFNKLFDQPPKEVKNKKLYCQLLFPLRMYKVVAFVLYSQVFSLASASLKIDRFLLVSGPKLL